MYSVEITYGDIMNTRDRISGYSDPEVHTKMFNAFQRFRKGVSKSNPAKRRNS